MKTVLLALSLLLSFPFLSQQTIDKTIISGGITRDYKLYIPASYSSTAAVPLVINLHGLGSDNFQQMFYGDFRPIADTANFIIVHPQGTYESTTLMANYWNAYFGGTVDDMSFLSELIDTISSNYNIDVNRIHSTGMSNGGFMSLALAAGLHDKIASVASITGSMSQLFPVTPNNNYPISVLQIQGTSDSTVKYAGDANTQSIASVLNYWISHNNTSTTPVIDSVPDINTTDNCTAIKYTYGGGTNNTEVIHYKIVGGEHTWPGSAFRIGITNQDINASKVAWDFFNKHQKVNTVGVSEIEKEILVSFNNDMANSKLVLQSKELNPNLNYVIYDINGKKIEGNQFTDSKTSIDTQSYKAGMYVIRVSNSNSSQVNSFKFVVK